MSLPPSAGVQLGAAAAAHPLALIADEHERCRAAVAARLGESGVSIRIRTIGPNAAMIAAALRLDRRAVLVLSCCDRSSHPLALLAEMRVQMQLVPVVVLAGPYGLCCEQHAAGLKPDAVVRSLAELAPAVQAVANAADIRPQWLARPRPLTPREAEIVQHVAAGLRNAQIAQTIGIAEKTVKVNLTNIYGKLGIHGRFELTALAPQLLSVGTPRRAAQM